MSTKAIVLAVLAALLGLLILVAAGLWLSYRAGQNQNELQCQATLTDLSAQSDKQKRISDEVIRNEETLRITQAQDAELRIQALAKRLDIARRTKPTPALGASLCDCRISDDAVRVLAETASDPYLKPPKYSSCLVAEGDAVTTDIMSEYTFTTIENYNSCARQLNSLIDVVGILYKNSP